jgi:hypothetical protein
MSHKFIALSIGALLLAPAAARATIIDGSFSGTMSGGTDTTGIFGVPAADLTGDTITGTFVYNTSLFSQSMAGPVNTATGTGLGALTVTITINSHSRTFIDQTSSSIVLDDSASQINLSAANNPGVTKAETFSLEADDIITPFIVSTALGQTFSTSDTFLNSTGAFAVADQGPTAQANGQFTIASISTTTGRTATPEPASIALLLVGLGGIVGARGRKARRATR